MITQRNNVWNTTAKVTASLYAYTFLFQQQRQGPVQVRTLTKQGGTGHSNRGKTEAQCWQPGQQAKQQWVVQPQLLGSQEAAALTLMLSTNHCYTIPTAHIPRILTQLYTARQGRWVRWDGDNNAEW